MANKHLSRRPHKIRRRLGVWWYEVPKGIEVYMEYQPKGVNSVTIPWASIRTALARKDKSDV